MNKLPNRFFVTGTDTDAGKTVISAMLTAGLNAYYWKPVQSGVREGTDTDTVATLSGCPKSHLLPEAYRLFEPLSPHEAAHIDGVSIDLEAIALPQIPQGAPLVVEGAGGVMVPLSDNALMLDLIEKLALPVVIVARSALGTINHTLLTVNALRERSIPIAGVVMNGPLNHANAEAIRQYGKVDILAEVEPLGDLSPQSLKEAFERFFSA